MQTPPCVRHGLIPNDPGPEASLVSSPDEPPGGAGDIDSPAEVGAAETEPSEGRPVDSSQQSEAPHQPPSDDADVVQYLDADGTPLPDVELPDVDDEILDRMYEALVFARRFDERAVTLQRQGRITTWAPMAGQEGSQVGSAAAMAEQDYLHPSYRENAAKVVRGADPAAILARQRGHAWPDDLDTGNRVLPESIPIASHLPHAVGGGMAASLRGDEAVHVAHFGDGATSEGDFHEALNMAGVYDTPTVFFCHNNGWAISQPTHRQTASSTYAQKAQAYGFDGVRVDGMDPLAVYDVTRTRLATARDDESPDPRPSMIEALEYRFGAHSTADDPSVYRDGVPEAWQARDPLPRFETFLRETGRLDDEAVDAVAARVDDRVQEAVERAEAIETDPDEMFDHVYADVPQQLERQRDELQRFRERHGDDAFSGL
jgi:pyruvate dehydrogenase E1 component alpha subunit